MLKEGKRGRGFLPPPGKDQPLRDEVLDKITINDLDELYTDDGPRSHSGVDVPPGGNGFGVPFAPGGFGGLFGGAFGPALPFHGSTPGFGSPLFGPQNREVITQFLYIILSLSWLTQTTLYSFPDQYCTYLNTSVLGLVWNKEPFLENGTSEYFCMFLRAAMPCT